MNILTYWTYTIIFTEEKKRRQAQEEAEKERVRQERKQKKMANKQKKDDKAPRKDEPSPVSKAGKHISWESIERC